MKAAPRKLPAPLVPIIAVEAGSVSRTKITGKPLASLANRAGSVRRFFNESMTSCASLRRFYGHHIPKAAEGNEAPGKAARKSGTPRAEEDRQARGKRSRRGTGRDPRGARSPGVIRHPIAHLRHPGERESAGLLLSPKIHGDPHTIDQRLDPIHFLQPHILHATFAHRANTLREPIFTARSMHHER